MGKKSSSKGHEPKAPEPAAKRANPLLYGVIIIAVVGVAAFALKGRSETPAAATPAATEADAARQAAAKAPSAEAEDAAREIAAMGPHKQAAYPPIPFQAYAPPRPPAVVTAAYEFAAEHPEILSYVPCFCGCEQGGHRGNHDCFVKARAANGDVVAWEPHGVECAVCIDVATRSRQMYSSGASVRDIRAAIEKEFVPTSPVMTPTPKPPAHDH